MKNTPTILTITNDCRLEGNKLQYMKRLELFSDRGMVRDIQVLEMEKTGKKTAYTLEKRTLDRETGKYYEPMKLRQTIPTKEGKDMEKDMESLPVARTDTARASTFTIETRYLK